MLLWNTTTGPVVQDGATCFQVPGHAWTDLVNRDDLADALRQAMTPGQQVAAVDERDVLPPIGPTQEIWAARVTYYRSPTPRMEESDAAGGSDFYDRVYHADRPELFLKATHHRVVGHGQAMHLRRDSKWIVPEPELTLVVTRTGRIIGYTCGNDLSCRDIEGENPLYLPQAKTFDRCAAIGPAIRVTDAPLPDKTAIRVTIRRAGQVLFDDATDLSQLKKQPNTLVDYLYRDNTFPAGCLLMTGTGIVPPNDFTLEPGDEVSITIDGIGTLVNAMA